MSVLLFAAMLARAGVVHTGPFLTAASFWSGWALLVSLVVYGWSRSLQPRPVP